MIKLSKYIIIGVLLSVPFYNLNAQTSTTKKPYGGVTLGYGYETNPLSVDELSINDQLITDGEQYLELIGYGYVPLNNQLYLTGKVYVKNYGDEFDHDNNPATASYNLDYQMLSFGVQYRAKFGDWKITPSLDAEISSYGGDDYQTVGKFGLKFDRRLSKLAKLRLFYQYSDITSENIRYDYLEGTRNRLRVDYRLRTVLGKLRLRYQLDLDDRQDRYLDGTKTDDYSPTRNTFSARFSKTLAGWNLSAKAEFRNSEYESVLDTNGNPFVREDDRLKLGFNVARMFSKDFKAGFAYGYMDNESTKPSRNYDNTDYQVYVEWMF